MEIIKQKLTIEDASMVEFEAVFLLLMLIVLSPCFLMDTTLRTRRYFFLMKRLKHAIKKRHGPASQEYINEVLVRKNLNSSTGSQSLLGQLKIQKAKKIVFKGKCDNTCECSRFQTSHDTCWKKIHHNSHKNSNDTRPIGMTFQDPYQHNVKRSMLVDARKWRYGMINLSTKSATLLDF